MKILVIGDVMGRPGRRALADLLPFLQNQHHADFTIVNGENAAGGYGITASTADDLFNAGANCITTGNHVWAQKQAVQLLQDRHDIIRPANYPPDVPGIGANVFTTASGETIAVLNLLGRIFMDPLDCPFRVASEILDQIKDDCSAIVVDFHAEATSEKIAMGFHLDGRVTAVIGTHTHVQTADEKILPGGTAHICDCGMTGPINTCIGVKPDIVLDRFLRAMPVRFEVPKRGPAQLEGVAIETTPGNITAQSIERLHVLTDDAQ